MTFWVIQTLNGLSLGMVLFLLSAGLSIIFGLMRIINLAHGSFYLIGAYTALSVINVTGSFWIALVVAPVVVGIIGIVLQRLLLERVQHNELAQVLLTFGMLLIFADLTLWIWGGLPQTLPQPEALRGAMRMDGLVFPKYRLVLTVVGVVIAILIWLVFERTRIGAVIRAGVDDAEMVRGIGFDISRIFTAVFGAGAMLAGLAGVLGGAMLGVYPGADFDVVLLAFAVVVIGGLGSLRGAFVGSLFIGMVDTFGKALMPEFSLVTAFVPMVLVLALRPQGLFGRA